MNVRPTPHLLKVLGVTFLLIGFVTFLSVLGHIRALGDFPWLFSAYGVMDIALGLGFLMQERWVLPVLGVNALGYTILHALAFIVGAPADFFYIAVNILTATSTWGVVYVLRSHLGDTVGGRVQAVVFILLWAVTYSISFINVIM